MMAVSGGCPSYGAMGAGRRPPGGAQRPVTFIRDIPLGDRHKICRMLDASYSWLELAGLLGFSNDDAQAFKRALLREGGSPTDEMLTVWDYGCHTVTELYQKLYEMKHARCMMVLKDLVDPSLHRLIQDVQGVQPTEEGSDSSETVHPGHSQLPPVAYIPGGAFGQSPHARKSSQNSRPGASLEATQASWHGADSVGKSQPGAAGNSNNPPHQKQQQQQQQQQQYGQGWAAAGEGLTVNMDKGSSEKVIGLGSPFKSWQAQKGEGALSVSTATSSSSNYHKCSSSNSKSELTSADSGGGGGPGVSAPSQELGEKEKRENYQNQSALSLLMHFNYDEIVQSTNNFNPTYKLGEGSFGTVYHAVIKRTHYAVKKLKQNKYMGFETNKIARADQMKELRALVTYRNPYIVALCAYCFDGPSPCLVYEFMENGSLEDNLLCKAQRGPLDWRTRHKIAEGAALGIHFLHTAQDQPLIHGDIKSANILLGKHMEPKIADFGLARLGPEDGKSYCYLKTKNAHGTLPYLPEEFKRSFKLSTKVDVYSFGVVLLEILAGERVADSRREPNKLLTDIVDEALELEEPEAVIEKIRDRRCPDWPWDIAEHLLKLARKCTTVKFTLRPKIDEAVNTLTNIAAEITRRDMIQQKREEFLPQSSQRQSPEVYSDQFGTQLRYSGHETAIHYLPASGGSGGGLDRAPAGRDWNTSVSSSLCTGPGLMPDPPRMEGGQLPPPSHHPPGRYPSYPDPRASFQPGYQRYASSSETSEENNLMAYERTLDSLSSMTSYDMSLRTADPSVCLPLLHQSQSSVPSSASYAYQPPAAGLYPGHQGYDPRQPAYPGQEPGYQAQMSQRYPPQQQQQQPPMPQHYWNPGGRDSLGGQPQAARHQAPEGGFRPPRLPMSVPEPHQSCSGPADLSLQEHMRQLDISQLPTKAFGQPAPAGPLPTLPPTTVTEASQRRLVPPSAARQPEQNTDIIPGCLKEKSVRPPTWAIAEEGGVEGEEEEGEEGSRLRSSLTTAEMRQFLSSRPREPSQQTEKMHGLGTSRLPPSSSLSSPAEEGAGSDCCDTAQSSLTTVQMREFLSGRREPTEETEESSTEKLDRALSLAAAAHQSKMAAQTAAIPTAAATATGGASCEQPPTTTATAVAHQSKMAAQMAAKPTAAPVAAAAAGTSTATSTTTTATAAAEEEKDDQMRHILAGQHLHPAEGTCIESGPLAEPGPSPVPPATARRVAPGNTGPLRMRAEKEAAAETEVCCSAPANMAAPLSANGLPQAAGGIKPGGTIDPPKDTQ